MLTTLFSSEIRKHTLPSFALIHANAVRTRHLSSCQKNYGIRHIREKERSVYEDFQQMSSICGDTANKYWI